MLDAEDKGGSSTGGDAKPQASSAARETAGDALAQELQALQGKTADAAGREDSKPAAPFSVLFSGLCSLFVGLSLFFSGFSYVLFRYYIFLYNIVIYGQ